jgi:hypothetical protein
MYKATISRRNPGCILLLLDQSSSMSEPFAGDPATSKAAAAATMANELVLEIVLRCQKELGTASHYFDLGVVGYGPDGGADFAWRGPLQGRALISVQEVRGNALRVEERTLKVSDGSGGLLEQMRRFPAWFDPVAENGASIAEALFLAGSALYNWAASHPDSFPPIVLVITGGLADPASFEGADPFEWVERLKRIQTIDGPVLVYSLYLSSAAVSSVLFPDTASELPDGIAKAWFKVSSVLPETLTENLINAGLDPKPEARGFALNCNMTRLIQAFQIGTRVDLRD